MVRIIYACPTAGKSFYLDWHKEHSPWPFQENTWMCVDTDDIGLALGIRSFWAPETNDRLIDMAEEYLQLVDQFDEGDTRILLLTNLIGLSRYDQIYIRSKSDLIAHMRKRDLEELGGDGSISAPWLLSWDAQNIVSKLDPGHKLPVTVLDETQFLTDFADVIEQV